MFKFDKQFESECVIRGVTYEVIADVQSTAILSEIANPEVNMVRQARHIQFLGCSHNDVMAGIGHLPGARRRHVGADPCVRPADRRQTSRT